MAHRKKESLTAIIDSVLKGLVETIFDEMLEQGGPKHVPKPDAVMEELNKRLPGLLGPPKMRSELASEVNLIRLPKLHPYKNAHHHAVNLFYQALMPVTSGAPSYPRELVEELRKLHSQGKSYGDIAKRLGLPTTPPNEFLKSKERIRKLIKRSEPKIASRKPFRREPG